MAKIFAFFKGLSDEINTDSLDFLFIKLHIIRHLPYINCKNELCFAPIQEHQLVNSCHHLTSTACMDHLKNGDSLTAEEVDIIFVPGLAFDKLGHRLGRGKGYYDRALAPLKSRDLKHVVTVGLAMDEQVVSQVPCEAHDVVMDFICTPTLGMFQIYK
jgi:5,10-methenyltetrahydrofolate synthetase